jgi:hypothetical protein
MPGIISLAGRTSVYKVLHDNTPVYADRPDRSRARSSSSTDNSSSNDYNHQHAPSSSASSLLITYPPPQASLKANIALVLRRGELVEVWNDRVVVVGNFDKSTSAKQALLLHRRRQRPESYPNISNMRFAPLTNDIGWISLSDAHLQEVDIARHPVQAFYVDNYPVGQCGLRQPIDRPEFRHFGCCASTVLGRRHHHHNHYVPGQVVFSCRSVKQGRATYYRLQRVPFPSASSLSASKTSTVTDSVWLVDSRPREAHEEHPHDDVTLLMPFDKVQVEGGPFAYACVRSIELRTRPDHSNASRSGRYLLKGDACVASLIRQSPFHYGNGPFGLLSAHTGLWCFEKINNSPPLLVPLEVERGDWKMQVRSRAPLPVLRQPVRQPLAASLLLPPGPLHDEHTEEDDEEEVEEGIFDGAAVVDATGSAHVVRLLRRDEMVRSDARFESPSTGTWFYRVVGLAFDHTDDTNDDNGMDDQVSDDVEVGWVPDRSPTGRRFLVEVRDEASPEDDRGGGLANGDAGDSNAQQPWSIDFVRGVAAIASRTVREVSAQPDRQRLVFLQGSIMIHVFVSTHTVEIEESTSQTIVQQRHCTPRQLSLILQDPREALRSRSNVSSNVSITELDPPMSHEDEMTIRQRLADCDDALEGALEKRREILEVLRPIEPMRRDEAIARLGGMDSMELVASSIPNPSSAPSAPDSVSMVVYNTSSSSPPPPLAGPALDEFADDTNHRSDPSSPPTGPDSMIKYNATSSSQPPPPLQAQALDEPVSGRRTAVSWEDMPRNANKPPSEKNWELAPTPTIHNSSRKRLETPEAPNDTPLQQHKHQPMKPLKEVEQQYDDHDDDRSAASSDNNDNASSDDDGTALSSLGEQLNRTCGVCRAFFETARARSVHCLKEHGKFSCNYCPEVFDYVTLLHRHRDQENHW